MNVKCILAAVGAFPQDEAVMHRGLELAAQHGITLTIVHVVDLPGYDSDLGRLDSVPGQAALAIRDDIHMALKRFGAAPDAVTIRIEAGSAALRLIDICHELSPDLVVMRAHQRANILAKILGSTTDRVIASAVAPVLVVRRVAQQPYTRVLVATNGADDAVDALNITAALLPDAALHLVQAVQIPAQLKQAMLRAGTDQATLTAHRDALAQKAQDQLGQLAAKTMQRVTLSVLHGDPATVLARATRSENVDLITVGPGRSSLIRRAFIGSVTRRLMRDAACDILVCQTLPG